MGNTKLQLMDVTIKTTVRRINVLHQTRKPDMCSG